MNRNGTRRVRTSGGGSSTIQKWLVSAATDWYLLGFAGPRHEAEAIKTAIATFLGTTLKLTLSPDKTLITHASTGTARFLGYELVSQHNDSKHDHRHQRSINEQLDYEFPTT